MVLEHVHEHFLPVFFVQADVKSSVLFSNAELILLKIGEYFQVQVSLHFSVVFIHMRSCHCIRAFFKLVCSVKKQAKKIRCVYNV